MSVSILDPSAWREFRGRPTNSGINETTHLAKVADQSGKLYDCFVKLLPLDGPALLCEAIGWLLARKSDLLCPAFGAIVLVPVPELRKCCPLPSKFDGMDFCPAWCSEIAAGKTVRQIHKLKYYLARKAFLRSTDARKIAAFDKWTDLRDRNFGNVIQSSKGGYVVIDHESLLHQLLWMPINQGFEEKSLLAEARSSLSQTEFRQFQLDMANSAIGHAQALKNAQADIEEIIGQMLSSHAAGVSQRVIQTLEQRSQPGWLSNFLGVIV